MQQQSQGFGGGFFGGSSPAASAAASVLGAGMSFMTSQLVGPAGSAASANSAAAAAAGPSSAHDAFAKAAAQAALDSGSSYVRQNVKGWFSWLSLDSLRPYFHVSNTYVVNKIALVLFPYPHRDWQRKPQGASLSVALGGGGVLGAPETLSRSPSLIQQQQQPGNGFGGFSGGGGGNSIASTPGASPPLFAAAAPAPPSRPVPPHVLAAADGMQLPPDDLNAPDLYLPLMAFVTYVLLRGYIAGLSDRFHPEHLSALASSTFAMLAVELILLRLTVFLAGSALAAPKLLDSVAYAGYKYIGFIATLGAGLVFGRAGFWTLLAFTSLSQAVFSIRVVAAATAAAAAAASLGAAGGTQHETAAAASCRRTSLLLLGAMQVVIALFLLRGAMPDSLAASLMPLGAGSSTGSAGGSGGGGGAGVGMGAGAVGAGGAAVGSGRRAGKMPKLQRQPAVGPDGDRDGDGGEGVVAERAAAGGKNRAKGAARGAVAEAEADDEFEGDDDQ